MTFPTQIIAVIAEELDKVPHVDQAVKRDLRPDDPNCIVSVVGGDWKPEDPEIGKSTFGAAHPASHGYYQIDIGLFVKMMGEEDGYALRNDITREIRDLVETQSDLRNNLIGLEETGSLENKETVRMMTVQNQRTGTFRVDDTGDFAFFSMTELIVKVET